MFKEARPDLGEYADTMTSYISWCEDVCTETKTVTLYGIQGAKCEAQKAVNKAKFEQKRKREDQFASNNTRTVWQSAAAIDNSDPSFPDQLNLIS